MATAAALLAWYPPARAAGPARDLTELSLEELTNVEVTSVSKREEHLVDAAAAVAVLGNEALRRSGATTIPDALRLVPGLHVAQITSNSWSVSARGFSSGNSDKLLVLTDSRSIYTPLFSGVFWDVQDLLLEDVDRVEVIRGPGASLWGTNAVNGVINITTKSAKDTQGAYFEAGAGTEERGFGAVRYGGQLGSDLYFRIVAKGFEKAPELNAPGPNDDRWKMGHLGLRADWEPDAKDKLTLQGDAYTGDVDQVRPSLMVADRPGPTGKLTALVAGGNVLARWTRLFSAGSDLQLRVYFDGTHRDDPTFLDDLATLDADLQHRFQLPLRQEIVWGLNFRSMDDRNRGKGVFALNPSDSVDYVASGFVQDRIDLLDSLKVTLGTKLEHNDFSGFEVQPTARAAWTPLRDHTLWIAASRAARVPTRLERDIDVGVTDPAANPSIRLLGNTELRSEILLAYEAGYRWQIGRAVFVDLAAYHDIYHRLASVEQDAVFVDPRTGQTVVPLVEKNLTDGVAQGGEASIALTPSRTARVIANYTYVFLRIEPRGMDLNHGSLLAGATPRNQVGVHAFLDLPARIQLDGSFLYASSIPVSSRVVPGEETPAWATVHARVSWRGLGALELSLAGRNLLQEHHREFPGGTELRRAVYAKIAGRF